MKIYLLTLSVEGNNLYRARNDVYEHVSGYCFSFSSLDLAKQTAELDAKNWATKIPDFEPEFIYKGISWEVGKSGVDVSTLTGREDWVAVIHERELHDNTLTFVE